MTFRDPNNVQPVVDGEVLVSFAEDPKFSWDGVPDESWETVGILNDGSKVELQKTIEKNKTSGWGFGVVATATKPGELTGSCEVLEDNATVHKIAWPKTKIEEGKVVDGTAEILYASEDIAQAHVAMARTNQDGTRELMVSRYKALCSMEDLGFSNEVTGKTITFDFKPGKNKDAFDRITLEASNEEIKNNDEIIRFGDIAAASTNPGTEEPGAEEPAA